MANLHQKLADSLKILNTLQLNGRVALRSVDFSRTHLKRLISNGFLREVMKSWYIASRPDDKEGDSTVWYTSFWDFCSEYLTYRFGSSWSLSPEQSLTLHAGNTRIPEQLMVRAPKASNKITILLYKTCLLDIRAHLPRPELIERIGKVQVFSIPAALVACSPHYFRQFPLEARSVLATVKEGAPLLHILLDGGHSTIAGRLVGAFRSIGNEDLAKEIIQTMTSAGYVIREENPFEDTLPKSLIKPEYGPAVNRLCLLWEKMKPEVIKIFPPIEGASKKDPLDQIVKKIEEIYTRDAYHSLSIEGYKVNSKLIEKVSKGNWNPENNPEDGESKDALAARGYWQSFQEVKKSLSAIIDGSSPGIVVEKDHKNWYRELFAPSVSAGIIDPIYLAGYRNGQVFIRRSRHIPPSKEKVHDLMASFFNLLTQEKNPAVRVVLGHFFFVYIHPYMDGNGRIGRFLMNLMLIAGGWSWTIIPVEKRTSYFEALEQASVHENIVPLTQFIGECLLNNNESNFSRGNIHEHLRIF